MSEYGVKGLENLKSEKYVAIEISYDTKWLVPFKEGMDLLKTLEYSLTMSTPYSKPAIISELTDQIKISVVSAQALKEKVIKDKLENP